MALIRSLEPDKHAARPPRTEVDCLYTTVRTDRGDKLLRLATLGSDHRNWNRSRARSSNWIKRSRKRSSGSSSKRSLAYRPLNYLMDGRQRVASRLSRAARSFVTVRAD